MTTIHELRATRIDVPLRHAYVGSRGVKRSYLKTLIRLTTSDGAVGHGETDGSDEVFARVKTLAAALADLQPLRDLDPAPAFARYRTAPKPERVAVGGIEMACWDIVGKLRGLPLHQLLGGKHRDSVAMVCEFSAAPFSGMVADAEIERFFADRSNTALVVAAAKAVVARDGYRAVKLKSIGRDPEWDVKVMRELRETLGMQMRLRHDPNGAYSADDAVALCRRLDALDLEWLEDPTSDLENLRRVRTAVRTPIATNMYAIDVAQLEHAIRIGAVDIVGIDPFHWAGLANARAAAERCRSAGLGVFMHCHFDLGVTTAAMLHLAASIEALPSGMDTCLYLQGTDIIQGGPPVIKAGQLAVPQGSGLGIAIDEAAVKTLAIEEFVARV